MKSFRDSPTSANPKSKRLFWVLLALAAIVAIFFVGRATVRNQSDNTEPAATIESVGKSAGFTVPDGWIDAKFTDQQQSDGVIARYQRLDVNATLVIRQQATTLPAKPNFKQISKDITDSLKREIAGIKVSGSSIAKVSGFDTIQVTYTTTPTKNQMIVIPLKQRTYYLVYTAGSGDFASLNGDIKTIDQNFLTYVKSNKLDQ